MDLTAPVRAGALRDELYRVCLDQALGRDAAFVAIAAVDTEKLGDPEYREAHLAAGLADCTWRPGWPTAPGRLRAWGQRVRDDLPQQ